MKVRGLNVDYVLSKLWHAIRRVQNPCHNPNSFNSVHLLTHSDVNRFSTRSEKASSNRSSDIVEAVHTEMLSPNEIKPNRAEAHSWLEN